jgi:hypothetical protein
MRCVWIATAVAACLVGCDNGPSNPSGPTPVKKADLARSVRIRQGDTTLQTGVAEQLTGEVLDASGTEVTGLSLSWVSNDPHVASVDTTGLVSTLTSGATLVIAAYHEFADTIAITVVSPPPPVTALSVWPDTNVIFTGMTRTLSLSVTRGGTTDDAPAQSWTTSDASVATVENGIVTGVGAGHATVTARFEDQDAPAIDVFVVPAPSPPLRFSTVSAAGNCGLTTDGLLYCWGGPFPGMSGPFDRCRDVSRAGTDYYRCGEIPRLVSDAIHFKALSGSCAVAVDGAVYCWGSNTYAGLGLGFADNTTRGLTRVPTDGEFVELSGDVLTHCALRIDGVVLCWGSNDSGDTGTGSSALGADGSWAVVTEPTPINTTVRFVKLGGGGNCGLATDSTAYCWGKFVGDSAYAGCNNVCNPSPVQVNSEKLVDLGTNGGTRCGIGVSRRAFCWGYHGSSPYRYTEPQEIPNPGFSSVGRILYAVDGSGAAFKIDQYGTLWRFNPQDTGLLRYKQYFGSCGIALDDKVYCGTEYGPNGKLLPGQ